MSPVPVHGSYRLRLDPNAANTLALEPGTLDIGRTAARTLGEVRADAAQLRFTLDVRGLWLDVRDVRHGVHVNGRPVRHMAMLRAGDAVYLDGYELQVLGREPDDASELPPLGDVAGDPRVVLRGTGGPFHGRSFTLEQPRLVGSGSDADIRIDDVRFAASHARLECLAQGQVLLRSLSDTAGIVVNGHRVRDALLQPGDQLVFDAHHRFVLEAPARAGQATTPVTPVSQPGEKVPGSSLRRLPWVLLAALLLAGLLSLLLFYGGR